MQDRIDNPQPPGTSNHPDSAEWVAFLYHESAPARRRELGAHLAACPACFAQIKTWRATQRDLDAWSPTLPSQATRPWLPALKLAAAAVIVLALGFGWGRFTASPAARMARIEASLADLRESVKQEHYFDLSNSVTLARAAAAAESLSLLTDYSRFQEAQRDNDQQTLKTTLDTLGSRLDKLRGELETVALNTQTSFELTHQNLARLVAFSTPAANPSSVLHPEPVTK